MEREPATARHPTEKQEEDLMAKHRKYEGGASATSKSSGGAGRHQPPSTGNGRTQRSGQISPGNITYQGQAKTNSFVRIISFLGKKGK